MAVVAALLLCGTAVTTVWGVRTLPRHARFPIALGVPPSVEGGVSRNAGLAIFALTALWLAVLTAYAASGSEPIGWVGVALMAFFLAIEVRLIRRLSRSHPS